MNKFKNILCHLVQYNNALISLQYAVHNDDTVSIRALSEIISIWKPSQKFASSLIKAYFNEGNKEKCLDIFSRQHVVMFKAFCKVCGDIEKEPSMFTEDLYEPMMHMFINLAQNALDDTTFVEVCGVMMGMAITLSEAGNPFLSEISTYVSEDTLTNMIGCYLRYMMSSGVDEDQIRKTMSQFTTHFSTQSM